MGLSKRKISITVIVLVLLIGSVILFVVVPTPPLRLSFLYTTNDAQIGAVGRFLGAPLEGGRALGLCSVKTSARCLQIPKKGKQPPHLTEAGSQSPSRKYRARDGV